SLDELVVARGTGPAAVTVGPLDLWVEAGSIALIQGDPVARRLVAAVVGGRLEPLSGRAQVTGHPLPSDAGKVSRLVAIADLSCPGRAGVTATLGELLEERLRLTSPWYLAPVAGRRARIRAGRVSGALQGLGRQTVPVAASTPVETLPQLERAVALAAVALSERTPVVLLDALDPFSDPRDARAFLLALDRLAPSGTTVVVGMPGLRRVAEVTPPRIRALNVSLVTEGALR
ncbi:MAG: hypothetical protein ABUT11_04840, partial [Leifsonia sp.]